MKKYSKYKDSGIAWIGGIPEHWVVKRLKFLTKFRNGFAHENDINDNGDFIVVNSKFVSTDGEVRKYCDTLIQPLYREDICIVMSDVPNGRAYAKCFVVNENFKYSLNQRVGAFYNYTLNRGYFYYFINRNKELMFYDDGFNQTNLRKPDLMSISVAYPNISEQEQIAKYLDWKCGEVDRIVDVRERQIKLLGELRTSVISRAVTRGLDPNAPLKDSGIEWIGQIPEHWGVGSYKRCMKINNGQDYKHIVATEGVPVVGSGGQFAFASDYMYEGEVVFLGRKGTVDKPMYYNGKFWAVDTMFYSIPNYYAFCKYMYYQALTFPFNRYSTATALPSMTQNDLANNQIAIPTINEQQQIADYLDKKTAEIDETIDKFKAQIDKIKEYRQALITEVVTGKIDVRGIEIPVSKSN